MYRKILVVLLLMNGVFLNAQISTNTPYSALGPGDVSFYGNAYMSGLGGTSTALIDSTQNNLMNPSSYSHLAKQLPLFSTGITYQQKTFSSEAGSSTGNYTGITHMSLIVPFANRLGLAFGLKPFSRTGYEINNYSLVNGDSIFYDYKGSGAIQEFIFGFSGKIIQRRNHSLTLGVNGKYYFGRNENIRKAYVKTNAGEVGGIAQNFLRAKALGAEFGLNYRFNPSRSHFFTFGATYRPQQQLNFTKSEARIFYQGFANLGSYDTIIAPTEVDGKLTMPDKLSAGIAYEFLPFKDSLSNSTKLPKLMFTAEYTLENWANYRENFGGETNNPNLSNSAAIRVGVEYTPHRIANDRSAYIKFYDKFRYRIGAYSVATPYSFNGKQLTDRGVTVGFGFPIVINRAVSSLNISASYGDVGADAGPGVLKENYYGFNLGINIAPSYDRWFKKYRLD